MFDSMWTNMAQSFLEALNFLIWLVPKFLRLLVFIFSPILAAIALSYLVLGTGWKHVAEVLKDKWVEKGWEKDWINHHNVHWASGVVGVLVNGAILSGFLLNSAIWIFTLYLLWKYGDLLLAVR